jgi:glycine dehydrogenase subunit 1
VDHLKSRSEFSTAYTPYQPEISQGTLQAIYEYQTLSARLMGMDVATASHYDGATALAEALLMATRITKRSKVAVSATIHPHYRQVIKSYLNPSKYEVTELPYLPNGTTDLSVLADSHDLAAMALQSPNFFGCIEDFKKAAAVLYDSGGLLVAAFTEALAYGLLKTPGSFGVDIVAGEGQSLGLPMAYGGPGLGMLGCRSKFLRNLPGRLVGRTKDAKGQDGFVLTLAAREQHIRREKATSNICTNNSHCALTAVIYMATLGGTGFKKLAQLNHDKAAYLQNALIKAGVGLPFKAPYFNEFVVKLPTKFKTNYQDLLKKKIVAGLPLVSYYPELSDHYLFSVTETLSQEDLDNLVTEVT